MGGWAGPGAGVTGGCTVGDIGPGAGVTGGCTVGDIVGCTGASGARCEAQYPSGPAARLQGSPVEEAIALHRDSMLPMSIGR